MTVWTACTVTSQ